MLIAFCVFAVVKFTARGPVRAAWNSGDFRAVYVASRAWARGLDCYDPAALSSIWNSAGVGVGPAPQLELHALYPPTTYVLLSPISQLTWTSAKFIWAVINLLALVLLWFCLARIGGLEPRLRDQSPVPRMRIRGSHVRGLPCDCLH